MSRMQRRVGGFCLIILLLLSGPVQSEGHLLPAWMRSLPESAWEADLRAEAVTVMPLDGQRTTELNDLLRHMSLQIAWEPTRHEDWSSGVWNVDDEPVLQLTQCTDGNLTTVEATGLAGAYVSAKNPWELLLGKEIPEADTRFLRLLSEADTLVETVASQQELFRTQKLSTVIRKYGKAEQRRTWEVKSAEAESMREKLLSLCPEGWLRELLSQVQFKGRQQLILVCNGDGSPLRVTYHGNITTLSGETRQLSLSWLRRRVIGDETDALVFKSPSRDGNARDNLTLSRRLQGGELGGELTLDFSLDSKRPARRVRTAGEVKLKLGTTGELSGTVQFRQETTGDLKKKTTLLLTPRLTLRPEDGCLLRGSLGWQLTEDGRETSAWKINGEIRPLNDRTWEIGAQPVSLDEIPIEECRALGSQMQTEVSLRLIRALVLLPEEDTLYLRRELPGWEQVLTAAEALREEGDHR